MTKYRCGYGRFHFMATENQAKLFGIAMCVIYMGLIVASVFFWTWLIEKFMI